MRLVSRSNRTPLWVIVAGVILIGACGGDVGITEPSRPSAGQPLLAVGLDPVTGATITTDQDDYVPGEIVHLEGAGWAPNETVHLHMVENPDTHDDVDQDVVADSSGTFSVHFYDVQVHDLGVIFTLTATGEMSGSSATAIFTDGNVRFITSPANLVASVSYDRFNANASCSGSPNGSPATLAYNTSIGVNTNNSIRVTVPTVSGYNYTGYTAPSGLVVTPASSPSATVLCVVGPASAATLTLNYAAAGKLDQTITFDALSDQTFGSPDFSANATASSGLAVSFTASGVCTITGSTVHLLGAGVCDITAHQAGNGSYNPAADVIRNFTVIPAGQSITFTSIAPSNAKYYGASYHPAATGGASGNPVVFGTSTPSVCTLNGTNTIDFVGVGTCTVTANQEGNADYQTASQVTQSFSVGKASSTTVVTFAVGPYIYTGSAFTASATVVGANGLDQSVSVDYSGDCTNVTSTNGCTATAVYPGDANHESSADTKSITILKAPSTTVVTFVTGPYIYRGTAFTATATVTGAGLNTTADVDYSGDCLNVTTTNGCTASGSYPGDANHESSSDAASITITKASSITLVTFEAGPYIYRGSAFTATASVSGVGGLSTTASVDYSGDCLNVTAGGCTGTATYGGDQNHTASTGAQTIFISKRLAAVSVNNAGKYFSDPDPSPLTTGSVSDFLAVDNVTIASFTRSAGEAVGSYPIHAVLASTGLLSNYDITEDAGVFTIAAWRLSGFYQPIDMSTTNGIVWNTVKNGSTVPAKFEIFKGTTELTDVSDVKSFTASLVACNLTTTDEIELTTTGATSLRYDATGGQFIQNWQTPRTPGKCYKIVMTARDGGSITAYFMLK